MTTLALSDYRRDRQAQRVEASAPALPALSQIALWNIAQQLKDDPEGAMKTADEYRVAKGWK